MHIADHASINKEMSQALLDRVSDAVFAVDEEWRYTYLNEAAVEMIDRDPEEMLGTPIWEAFPELIGTRFETAIRAGATTQEVRRVEEYLPEHDRWYDIQIYPDDTGVSLHIQDITDGKAKDRRRHSLTSPTAHDSSTSCSLTPTTSSRSHYVASSRKLSGAIGGPPQIRSSKSTALSRTPSRPILNFSR